MGGRRAVTFRALAAARERRRGWRSGVTGPRRSTRPPSTAMDPQKPSEESDIKYWGNGKTERVGRVLVIDTAKWAVGRRGSVERLTHRSAGSGAVVDHCNLTSTCAYCQTDTVQSVITLRPSSTTMQHIKHLKWLHTSRKHALLALHFSTHINRILRLMDVLADTNYTILYFRVSTVERYAKRWFYCKYKTS